MRGTKSYERRTMLVHQPNGPSIRGVLRHAYRDCFVLAHAHDLDHDVALAGEVVIPKTGGVWMQAVETMEVAG